MLMRRLPPDTVLRSSETATPAYGHLRRVAPFYFLLYLLRTFPSVLEKHQSSFFSSQHQWCFCYSPQDLSMVFSLRRGGAQRLLPAPIAAITITARSFVQNCM